MKFKLENIRCHEDGQAMVEFALVLPLFIILLCFIIDCGWIGYQCILFDYAYRDASWELKIPTSESMYVQPHKIDDYYAKYYIKNGILNVGANDDKSSNLLINPDNLQVSNSSITLTPGERRERNPGATWGTYENVKYNTIDMLIEADLQYVIHVITPVGQKIIGQTVTTNKHLNKDRLLSLKQDPRFGN